MHNPARAQLYFNPEAEKVSKETARGLEELLILQCETLKPGILQYNQIHGVSLKNPNRTIYMKLAQIWASENLIECGPK